MSWTKDLDPEADNNGAQSPHRLVSPLDRPDHLLLSWGGGRECEEGRGEGSCVEREGEGRLLA